MFDNITKENLGNRICIIGRSCAGKSTLADNMSRAFGLSVLHLDQIAFIPHTNWQRCPDEEFAIKHAEFLETHEKWVIEGNYSITMSERLTACDSVIFADFSRNDYLWQYIKRCVISYFRPQSRIGAMEGAKSEFNWEMVHFVWNQYPPNSAKYYEMLREYCAGKPVIKLKNFSELQGLYGVLGLSHKKI